MFPGRPPSESKKYDVIHPAYLSIIKFTPYTALPVSQIRWNVMDKMTDRPLVDHTPNPSPICHRLYMNMIDKKVI